MSDKASQVGPFVVRLTLDTDGTYYRYGATRSETFDSEETTWTIDRARRFPTIEQAQSWIDHRPGLVTLDVFKAAEVVSVREAVRDLHSRLEKKNS